MPATFIDTALGHPLPGKVMSRRGVGPGLWSLQMELSQGIRGGLVESTEEEGSPSIDEKKGAFELIRPGLN